MTLHSRVVQALQTTQVNTHVTGTGDIKLESGRDTDLKGAIVSGEKVMANVGRDLNIVSVPEVGDNGFDCDLIEDKGHVSIFHPTER
ncbi:hypothetical protein C5748_19720 [Phyllobacterium phragmitis]|uniref:Uncharacterized protein n=1 Tax=Phyllobacterium phragmitis TaxID=2670329 RepID=A0A2S9IMX2_9HYPH|nr:hemagglutinin repeat-containing protein [Phyllobacterium phragmitis]PRD41881.1 hypothetical protein C5748_19720 [Phyllobacterium phragmitis]